MDAFPAIDDLLGQVRRLAQRHAGRATLSSYGRSQGGEALWALRLGGGPRRVLVYAFPQPDEPLGGLGILMLARRLVRDRELLQRATWLLLPCVDPDGARLNEGWFTAPPAYTSYVLEHYRPPEGEQVEWSFPSADPAWPWDRVGPEARALQAVLDAFRPHFLFPLHNALLGGGYAFVSSSAADLARRLPPLWQARGLPTHRGEPELPFAPQVAPGVYRLPTLREIAAALASQGVRDPAALLACGAPVYAYAERQGEVVTVVPELPLFAVPGIDDTRPTTSSRREVLGQAWAEDKAAFERWQAFFGRAEPLLVHDTPYWRALAAHARTTPSLLAASRAWLDSDRALERPATVAQTVDCRQIASYVRLLPFGTLIQALEAEVAGGDPPPAVTALLQEVGRSLQRALGDLRPSLPAEAVPPSLLGEVVAELVCSVVCQGG